MLKTIIKSSLRIVFTITSKQVEQECRQEHHRAAGPFSFEVSKDLAWAGASCVPYQSSEQHHSMGQLGNVALC